jgi:hypothetical protein
VIELSPQAFVLQHHFRLVPFDLPTAAEATLPSAFLPEASILAESSARNG